MIRSDACIENEKAHPETSLYKLADHTYAGDRQNMKKHF
jgi:hypothetical protein